MSSPWLRVTVLQWPLLLEAGADVNAVDDVQESAIFRITNPDIVPLLLEHKIDLNLKNQNGLTALRAWQECLQDSAQDSAYHHEAQAMVSALQLAEQNIGWNNVTTKRMKRAHSRLCSRSPPRSRSPLAHGRAAEEA